MSRWNIIPTREQLSINRRSPALRWGLARTAEHTALGVAFRRLFAWWGASLVLSIPAMLAAGGITASGWLSEEVAFNLVFALLSLLPLGPLTILCTWAIRRMNDTGRSWAWLSPLWAVPTLMATAFGLEHLDILGPVRPSLEALQVLMVGLAIGHIIWLVKAKGDPGVNRYGPAPSPASEPR